MAETCRRKKHPQGKVFSQQRLIWTVVLENTLEHPLDCKEIQPVSPKGNQPWIFIARTDAEAEAPIPWPPDVKSQLIGKRPRCIWKKHLSSLERLRAGGEAGGRELDVGWHHWLDGCESEWTLGVGDGQGGLVCCDSWDHKESDTTERLIWSDHSLP